MVFADDGGLVGRLPIALIASASGSIFGHTSSLFPIDFLKREILYYESTDFSISAIDIFSGPDHESDEPLHKYVTIYLGEPSWQWRTPGIRVASFRSPLSVVIASGVDGRECPVTQKKAKLKASEETEPLREADEEEKPPAEVAQVNRRPIGWLSMPSIHGVVNNRGTKAIH
jgi:hypothetical protein